jgi:predicted Rdx family selenoprotein
VFENAQGDAYFKVAASNTPENEIIEIKNTYGSDPGAITLVSGAGGITAKVVDGKDLTLGNALGDTYVKVSASGAAESEKIAILNTPGNTNDAIKLNADAGGILAMVADEKTLVLGNAQGDAYFKVAASADAEDEKIEILNTVGDQADAIKLNAEAGGILAMVADEKTLVLGNAQGDAYFKVAASNTPENEKIEILNTVGDQADAIKLNAEAGGILARVADEKTLVLGNAQGDAYFKVAASNTPENEIIEIKNTYGSDPGAITLVSGAGGITAKVVDGKDLTLGNALGDTYVKVSASGAAESEKIAILNTPGNTNDAIKLNADAGGILAMVADEKTLVLGNAQGDAYFKVAASADAEDEKIEILNTVGDQADAIKLNAEAGGILAMVADEKTLVLGNAQGDAYFKVAASNTPENEKIEILNTVGDQADAIKLNAEAGGILAKVADEKTLVLGNVNSDTYFKIAASNIGSGDIVEIKNTTGATDASIAITSVVGGITAKVADGKNLILGNTDSDAYVAPVVFLISTISPDPILLAAILKYVSLLTFPNTSVFSSATLAKIPPASAFSLIASAWSPTVFRISIFSFSGVLLAATLKYASP